MPEIVICCPHNTKGINPATGRPWRDGDEFLSEAQGYCAFHGDLARFELIDNRLPSRQRFTQLLQLFIVNGIERRYDAVTVFCHGLKSGLQVGADLTNVARLAEAMASACAKDVTITLYACSAGADDDADLQDEREPGPGGDGGFADQLRDQLFNYGTNARVLAHTVRGHTTRNPFVREFVPGDAGLVGGDWLVGPDSFRWGAWCSALRGGHMRFMFPKMTRAQVHEALR